MSMPPVPALSKEIRIYKNFIKGHITMKLFARPHKNMSCTCTLYLDDLKPVRGV